MGFKVTGDLEVTGAVKIGADTLTATGAELNFVDGVTSAIQTQIDSKAGLTNWGTPQGGYKFDGVDDYVSVADNANLDFGTGDFSVELGFNVSKLTGEQYLLYKGAVGTRAGYAIVLSASNAQLLVSLQDTGTTNYNVIPISSLAVNTKYHLVCSATRTGNLVTYLNGVSITSLSLSARTGSLSGTANAIFGTWSGFTDLMQGDIRLARLYNRALTQAEITSLYNNGRPDLASLPYDMIGGSQTNLATGATWSTNTDLYETFTSSDNSITSAINTSGAGRAITSNVLNVKIGEKYRVKFTLTLNSGQAPYGCRLRDAVAGNNYSADFTSVNGANVQELTITRTGACGLMLYNDSATDYALADLEFTKIGCVAEYLPQNAGKFGWQETQNGLNGATSGSPVCLTAEQRALTIRDTKLAIATATPTLLTALVPKGYKIVSIVAKGSDALTAIKIGTSSSGEQIVASSTATATGTILTLASTANDGFSQTTDTNVYVEHTTSAQTMDVCFILEKLTR